MTTRKNVLDALNQAKAALVVANTRRVVVEAAAIKANPHVEKVSREDLQKLRRDSDFLTGYVDAALWSGLDAQDRKYESYANLSKKLFDKMVSDCAQFEADNSDALAATERQDSYNGHDFWLSRNHHGAGFWDGDLPEDIGKKLTDAAHKFGEVNLYVDPNPDADGDPDPVILSYEE